MLNQLQLLPMPIIKNLTKTWINFEFVGQYVYFWSEKVQNEISVKLD
jgi:hypothetical protein